MLKLQFKNNPNRGFWLVGEQLSIGVDPSCHVVLEGLGVSDHHAVIDINGESLSLVPTAGVHCLVNNKPVTESRELYCNDEIRIGVDVLVVVDPKVQVEASRVVKEHPAVQLKTWSLRAAHPKLQERLFKLEGKHIIGRSKGVDIFIPYKLLSREHAEITVLEEGLMLQDLNSANGCFVNGERVTQCLLTGGERIKFANLEFAVIPPQPKIEKSVPINATMIRQAVSDEDIKRAQQNSRQQRTQGISQLLADGVKGDQNPPQYSTWIAVLVLLSLSLGAAWWYF